MPYKQDPSITIRHIKIRNYKGVDKLELEFPLPRLHEDPDIIVMGSRNGLGKTSVIECCSLLLLSPFLKRALISLNRRNSAINVPDLLVRAGKDFAEFEGKIVFGNESTSLRMRIDSHGRVELSGEKSFQEFLENRRTESWSYADSLINAICGFTPNPVIEAAFLLFHSYRKVQEGNLEMGMMVRDRRVWHRQWEGERFRSPMSAFKLKILQALMAQAELFEFIDENESIKSITTLKKLVSTYAGGTIDKLRSSPDNTIDFRVKPNYGESSFTFDGLSSGQKEIISTLFLIWYHTNNRPSVVFIDEPELHLNAQWHQIFVRNLIELAPWNQYIMATHSEDVMDSVEADRRVLLSGFPGSEE